jgi:hypothetical protein
MPRAGAKLRAGHLQRKRDSEFQPVKPQQQRRQNRPDHRAELCGVSEHPEPVHRFATLPVEVSASLPLSF